MPDLITPADPVADAERLDEMLATIADEHGIPALGNDGRLLLHGVIVALETALGRVADLEQQDPLSNRALRNAIDAERKTYRAKISELGDEKRRLAARVAELESKMRATSAAVEQRARVEDATGIASVYCAWWDASALVDQTLGLSDAGESGDEAEVDDIPRCACGATAAFSVGYHGEDATVFQCVRCATADRRTPFFHRDVQTYIVHTCGPTPNGLVCACGGPVGHRDRATEEAAE